MKLFCEKCGWVLLDQQCNETKCCMIRDEMLRVVAIKKENKNLATNDKSTMLRLP